MHVRTLQNKINVSHIKYIIKPTLRNVRRLLLKTICTICYFSLDDANVSMLHTFCSNKALYRAKRINICKDAHLWLRGMFSFMCRTNCNLPMVEIVAKSAHLFGAPLPCLLPHDPSHDCAAGCVRFLLLSLPEKNVRTSSLFQRLFRFF